MMTARLAGIADAPADYERLGLSRSEIAPWEDGARTDDSPGTYEWWYFDAHLADGAKLVVSFMNKETIAEPKKPLAPVLRLGLDLADGRHFEKPAPGRRPRTTRTYAWETTGSPGTCIATGSTPLRKRSLST
jgi:hypothetical protein